MELADGELPDGERYISRGGAARAPRCRRSQIGKDATYGMGLMVDTQVRRPGRAPRRRHDRLPQRHDVAARARRRRRGAHQRRPGLGRCGRFRRKLLEVLFDGRAEADADSPRSEDVLTTELAAERKLLTVPADAARAAKLAQRYRNDALGDIIVTRRPGYDSVRLRRVEERGGARKNPDGTFSFVTTAPGIRVRVRRGRAGPSAR